MYLAGKKYMNAGPLAMAFRNDHLDTDGCTCLEKNKNAGTLAMAFGNAHLDMEGCTWLERKK
jgi:hypothetical protein